MAGYTTIAKARAAGISEVIEPVEANLTIQINRWSEFIDRECRQWFESRTLTVQVDGNGTDTLFLPVPIISITSLYTNDNFVAALAATEYHVYSGTKLPDDRPNPKIRLHPATNVFGGAQNLLSPPIFCRGRRNQKIIGAFGYMDYLAETPEAIADICLRLVIRYYQNKPSYTGAGGSSGPGPVGPKASETTDRHTVRYATPQITGMRMGSLAITGDPYIDAVLVRYRGPKLISTSSSAIFQTRM